MAENLILVHPSLDWEEGLLAYKDAFKDENMYGWADLYQFDKVFSASLHNEYLGIIFQTLL